MSAPSYDPSEAKRLLNLIHPNGYGFVVAAIVKGGLIPRYVADSNAIERIICELVTIQERKGAIGVYYGMGEHSTKPKSRGSEHEVARIRCVYSDVDKPTKVAALERIDAFVTRTGLAASVLIDTGGGYQCLWLLRHPVDVGPYPKEKPTPEALRVRAINAMLARELDGDSTIDLSRVFRLPGTLNTKCNDPKKYPSYREPLPCRILDVDAERCYTLEDLERHVTGADRMKAQKKVIELPKLGEVILALPDLNDAKLIERAKSARNGAKFSALWDGDTSGYGSDESRADLALCSELAFWTEKDPVRIDRLFRQSGLYRDKWDREDYRNRTIQKAIETTSTVYTPEGNGHSGQTPARRVETAALTALIAEPAESRTPRFPEEAVSLAPGPLRDVLLFWEGKTEAPRQFILMAAATYAGALLGRAVGTPYANRSLLHPVFFTALIAPTGLVKTTAERIAMLSVIGEDRDANTLGLALHSGMVSSGVSLAEALEEAKELPLLWRVPELDTLLAHAARDGAGDLASMLATCYDGRTYTHKRARTNKAGTIRIERPTLAFIATGQERGVRTNLDPGMVGVGFINRTLFSCAEPSDVVLVPFPEDVVADEGSLDQVRENIGAIVATWRGIRNVSGGLSAHLNAEPKVVSLSGDARAWWEAYYRKHKAELNEAKNGNELTIREPEHVRKLALLRAALEQRKEIVAEDLQWGHAIAGYSSACTVYLCDGAGGGESRRDVKAQLFAEALHKAEGTWVRIRDFARQKRKSIGDPEELRRIIDNGERNGLWVTATVRGSRGPAAPVAKCICKDCAEKEGESAI